MAKSKAFFSVVIQDQILEFDSLDEINGWIANERDQWRWLLDGRIEHLGNAMQAFRNRVNEGLGSIAHTLDAWKRNPSDQDAANKLSGVFKNVYEPSRKVVPSNHPFSKQASQIAKADGPLAGAAALGFLLKIEQTPSNASAVAGILEAILFRDGITKKSSAIVEQSIKGFIADGESKLNKRFADLAERLQATEEFLVDARKKQSQQVENLNQQWAEIRTRMSNEASDAIASIRATESKYKMEMALRAPVQYWKDEGARHRTETATLKASLINFVKWGGGVLCLVVIALIVAMARFPLPKDDPFPYIAATTGVALLTTVLFWAGRILVRLYLSSRHLATDADERVAMAQTFLALSADNKVEGSERALVLAPLFRSSADGIVKDEGAPDLTLAGLFSRFLTDRK